MTSALRTTRAMGHRHQKLLLGIVTFIAAATFLFVVLYPYTPTPTALGIDKTEAAPIEAIPYACLLLAPIFVIVTSVCGVYKPPLRPYYPEILPLICLRLR
jgi:hypothetical protein